MNNNPSHEARKRRIINLAVDFVTLVVGSGVLMTGFSECVRQGSADAAGTAGLGASLIALFFWIRYSLRRNQ